MPKSLAARIGKVENEKMSSKASLNIRQTLHFASPANRASHANSMHICRNPTQLHTLQILVTFLKLALFSDYRPRHQSTVSCIHRYLHFGDCPKKPIKRLIACAEPENAVTSLPARGQPDSGPDAMSVRLACASPAEDNCTSLLACCLLRVSLAYCLRHETNPIHRSCGN